MKVEDITDLWVSEAVLLLIAPSVERHGSRVGVQVQFQDEQKPIHESVDRRSKVCEYALRSTKEELAKNLRQMGWRNIWKNARRVESASSSRNGNAAFRGETVGFHLAAHFLHAIVVFVDFMTF